MTQKKIAEMLGLSVATVSLALRDDPKIKRETREKVKGLAKLSNYRPNEAARSLSCGKTFSVGIILPEFSHPFYADLSEHLHQCLKREGYVGLFFPTSSRQDFHEAVDVLLQRNVDGIISKPVEPHMAARCLKEQVPVVFYAMRDDAFDVVLSDRYKGAYMAAGHLLGLGHRKIGFFGKNDEYEARYLGFKHAMLENGLTIEPQWVIENEGSYDSGCRCMQDFLDKATELPTAMFFHSDAEAIGAMHVLSKRGIRIPQDISVIGYDDIREAEYACVPLTTIRTDRVKLAENMVNLLMKRINANDKDKECAKPEKIFIEPELIIRDSCGRPRE